MYSCFLSLGSKNDILAVAHVLVTLVIFAGIGWALARKPCPIHSFLVLTCRKDTEESSPGKNESVPPVFVRL